MRSYGQNDFMDIWAFLMVPSPPSEDYYSPLPNISTLAIFLSPRKSTQMTKVGSSNEFPGPGFSVERLQKPGISQKYPVNPDFGEYGITTFRFGGDMMLICWATLNYYFLK